jgi:hypothetical protein
MNPERDLASRLARGEYEIDPARVADAMVRRLRRPVPGLGMLVPALLEDLSAGGAQDGAAPGLGAA